MHKAGFMEVLSMETVAKDGSCLYVAFWIIQNSAQLQANTKTITEFLWGKENVVMWLC
jgi:hypothetical protein